MRGIGSLLSGTATAFAMLAATAPAAMAQDVVVMRRVIAPPTRAMTGSPTNPVGYYSWAATAWSFPATTCGMPNTATRTVSCVRTGNVPVDESNCMGNGSGNRPETTLAFTGACNGGSPTPTPTPGTPTPTPGTSTPTPGTGTPTPTPGTSTPTPGTSTPTPGTSTPTPGTSTPTPGTSTPTPGTSTPTPGQGTPTPAPAPAPTYGWVVSGFGQPSSTCGSATSARSVICQRSDGASADESLCGGVRPSGSQTTYETSGCGHSWNEGPWDNPIASCGPTTQRRSVTCLRSDGQTVNDSVCAATAEKPATSQPSTDYGKCSYAWSVGSYSAPNTTCGTVTQTRSVYCQRSDGQPSSAASCTETKPETTQTSYDTTGCTFSWDKTAFGPATPACGASTHSRTVTCKRSDNQPATSGQCDATTKPTTSEPINDYGTCSYDWAVGAWNGAAQCGQTVTQTRSVTCARSDGGTAPDYQCSDKGQKPAASQPITDYTGCKYTWRQVVGPWSSTCSDAATRTNAVSCQRSDGTAVGESLCDGATKPTTSDTKAVLSSCTYMPTYGEYGTCTSSTSGSTKGTQTAAIVSCARSDGKAVENGMCTPQTSSLACTPPNTSDQFFRQPASLVDPNANGQNTTYRFQNPVGATTLKLSVGATQCWDAVNKKTVAATSCNGLTFGSNVYDVVSLPATQVSGLREVYINRIDVEAAMPNADNLMNYAVTTACAGSARAVIGTSTSSVAWPVFCGTPDTAEHYSREPANLYDPGGSFNDYSVNTNYNATTYGMKVSSTLCWDTATSATSVKSSKCTYLPTGTSAGDKFMFPATFVKDLREVYVNMADLKAAIPHADNYDGVSLATFCNGRQIRIGTSSYQTWALRCGTPDTADHYLREPASLYDPGGTFNDYSVNTNYSASRYVMVSNGTLCRDLKTDTTVGSLKCSYLPTGSNSGDKFSFPATFVKNLREIYVNMADLRPALPHADNYDGVSLATFCNSRQVRIGSSSYQTWVLRCGTPDTDDHYVRDISSLYDPGGTFSNYSVNTNFNATQYVMVSNSTSCWDTTTNTSASSTKCSYLPTGGNVNDKVSFPATFVKNLREVYVNMTDLQAALPHGNNYDGVALASFCNSRQIRIGTSSYQIWVLRCGTADTDDHYVRDISSLYDPGGTLGDYTANTNFSATQYVMTSNSTSCWDTTANASAPSIKCDYLPTGGKSGDKVTFPATFVKNLREVYVNMADLKAALPHGNNYDGLALASFCNSRQIRIGNPYQIWTLRCGTADTDDHYATYAAGLADPYVYYTTSAGRTVNTTTSSLLKMSQINFACWDKNKNSVSSPSTKCDYLPGNAASGDQTSVPAIWNTAAKTVTVNYTDIKAVNPYITTAQLGSYMCNSSWTVQGGVPGNYKVLCQ